ncbi:DUF2304 domain-containing protein [Psychrobacillus lasiicapitis]|nr:DUF2304 domain-containing protein [Psychrobacillus lasiicapitis]
MLQIFIIGCAILFATFVISLLLRNKIGERNSVIWLGGLIVILVISSNPSLFDSVARGLGINYPPALLFFLSSLILLTFSLYQTVQITKLSIKIKDISQHIALGFEDKQQYPTIQLENEIEDHATDE